ncbi:hypothetical protein [Granulicella sp. L60]|uniref:hypothetical protein n=1 Tax=Granulicella sp. L60 TaxID=1641866 RepID=UPI00131E0208|nr:hypothetical protein [Granulicella sp. L60]
MSKGPFEAQSFIPTRFSTAEEKAKFGNIFLHFIASDWKDSLFTKSFYTRLSNCFGHIAHFDRNGFIATWFTCEKHRFEFIRHTLAWPCYGQPEHTFCDVEAAIQVEVRKRNYLELYRMRSEEELRSAEMALLERLEGKYRKPAPPATDAEIAIHPASTDFVAERQTKRHPLSEAVQQSLF